MTRRTALFGWASMLLVPVAFAGGVLLFPTDRRWAALLPRRQPALTPGVR